MQRQQPTNSLVYN